MSDFLYWFKVNGVLLTYFILLFAVLATGCLTIFRRMSDFYTIRICIIFSVVWLLFTFMMCLFKGSTQILR